MTFIHCSWCHHFIRKYLYSKICFIFKPSAVAENVFSLTLNVGWKCHFQFSQLSQLHEWNFFQLSEWKNYCHFLWLSIYLLQHSINLYTPKTFSARVVPKSNFFSAGKYILTATCCRIVIASNFLSCLKILFQSYCYVNLMNLSSDNYDRLIIRLCYRYKFELYIWLL